MPNHCQPIVKDLSPAGENKIRDYIEFIDDIVLSLLSIQIRNEQVSGEPTRVSIWLFLMGDRSAKKCRHPGKAFLDNSPPFSDIFPVLSPSGFPPALAPFNVRANDSLEFELQPHETRSASMESSGVVRQSSPGSHVVPLFDQRFGWRDIAI